MANCCGCGDRNWDGLDEVDVVVLIVLLRVILTVEVVVRGLVLALAVAV